MNKKKILVLMHTDLVPPQEIDPQKYKEKDINQEPWITEYNVVSTLKKSGHNVMELGVYGDLSTIRKAVEEFKPNIVFNLLEEFHGEALFDQNVVSYLELLQVPYTGSNPRGLILARDKAITKKILSYHRIKSPKFVVFPKNRKVKKPKALQYPLIVKCLAEEASLGIAQASVVHNDEKLKERVEYINKNIGVDAIAEEFIEGAEYYVGVYGNYQLKTLPILQLVFDKSESPEKEIYSRRAKWNEKYRDRKGIDTKKADISKELEKKIIETCKKTYKALYINGYARIDLRVDKSGNVFVIEANPNPNIGIEDEFAQSAKKEKFKYPQLLEKIIQLGISWHRKY